MSYKKDWEEQIFNEFQECEWDEIRQLLKNAYTKASNDLNGEHEYTHLVMFNLRMLAKYGIEKITFAQWKSFRAYTRIENKIPTDIEIQKLFNNENTARD